MTQARLLPHRHAIVDRERQRRRRGQDLELLDHDLDGTGGQVRVLVALGPARDGADDLDAELVAQRVRDLRVVDHHLHDAAGVAEVEEGHAAVVAT